VAHLLLLQLVTKVVITRVVVIRTTRVTSTTRAAAKEGTTIRWEEEEHTELELEARALQPLT